MLRLLLKVVLKVALLHACFSRFLNCTSGNILRKPSQFVKTELVFLVWGKKISAILY